MIINHKLMAFIQYHIVYIFCNTYHFVAGILELFLFDTFHELF
jgi:hypothetical protein